MQSYKQRLQYNSYEKISLAAIRSPVQGSTDHLVRVGPRTDWFSAVDPWSFD